MQNTRKNLYRTIRKEERTLGYEITLERKKENGDTTINNFRGSSYKGIDLLYCQ